MAQSKKQFLPRQGAFVLLLWVFCLSALAFVCAVQASAHKKKQSDLAPNTVGDATPIANGTLIRFAGIPGFTYTIESSSDGTNWTAITSIIAPPNGLMKYLDSSSPAGSQLYRT